MGGALCRSPWHPFAFYQDIACLKLTILSMFQRFHRHPGKHFGARKVHLPSKLSPLGPITPRGEGSWQRLLGKPSQPTAVITFSMCHNPASVSGMFTVIGTYTGALPSGSLQSRRPGLPNQLHDKANLLSSSKKGGRGSRRPGEEESYPGPELGVAILEAQFHSLHKACH